MHWLSFWVGALVSWLVAWLVDYLICRPRRQAELARLTAKWELANVEAAALRAERDRQPRTAEGEKDNR